MLRGMLGLAAAGGIAPALSGCTGFATSGGDGTLFLSTQFAPVDEAQRFRQTLAGATRTPVSYVTADSGSFAAQITAQIRTGHTLASLLGGLHGDLAPLADGRLTDLTGLVAGLGDLGWPPEYVALAKVGTDRTWYVPWAQASYILAAHEDALAHLPSGADFTGLTYDQLLDWAIAARRAAGRPVLGFPAGPSGLFDRFLQGFLLPSFTGGQVSTFRSAGAVHAWQYLRELWANCVPAGTTYNFMEDPMASGEVSIAWDHVARLLSALPAKPGPWQLAPSPRGPAGLGYMVVLAGLAIPKGAPDPSDAQTLISALCQPATQVAVAAANAFFPVVRANLPPSVPAPIRMLADAIEQQRSAPGALISLPPVGLGALADQVTNVFTDAFKEIVLDGANIQSTLDAQAKVLDQLIRQSGAPCWAPDPASGTTPCEVH
jgi:multiple sugar transport system substrate-binding protein